MEEPLTVRSAKQQEGRLLGLDFGDKTVGVAVSDPLGLTAQGVEIVRRERPTKLRRTLARLEEIAAEYGVSAVVLGYPKHLDNTQSERCLATKEFARLFIQRTSLTLYLWDERLTSAASERTLGELGIRGEKKQAYVDELAAMLILQGFMDARGAGKEMTPYVP